MKATIAVGDCRIVLKSIPDCSIDSIVTDPPYGLEFMGKDWDAPWKTDRRQGFDGSKYDHRKNPYGGTGVRNGTGASYGADARIMQAFQDWCEEWARECLRVLKPGGHLLSFGGSRTYHRMACAIEDAGFEVRDQIMWLYGSGFPKSLDVSKAIDKAAGAKREVIRREDRRGAFDGVERDSEGHSNEYGSITNKGAVAITAPATDAAKQWEGWGTALKPAHEPIVVARKPLTGTVAANVLEHGTGALNIDGCRIAGVMDGVWGSSNKTVDPTRTFVGSPDAAEYKTAPHPSGRWPANVIHDGSEEVVSRFPDTSSGAMAAGTMRATQGGPGSVCYGTYGGRATVTDIIGNSGSAARFFYTAKADKTEREMGCYDLQESPLAYGNQAQAEVKRGNTEHKGDSGINSVKMRGNNHPTVKPIDLMRYLCRLVTPPGGTVLDHFAGSGSTGVAALMEDFNFFGIDINVGYASIAEKRMKEVAPLLHEVELSLGTDQSSVPEAAASLFS